MKKWDKKSEGNSPVAWSSWLADEPIPIDQVRPAAQVRPRQRPVSPEELRRQRVRFAGLDRPQAIQSTPASPKQISINIELKKPDLSKVRTLAGQAKTKLPNLRHKRFVLPAGIVATVALITVVGFQIFNTKQGTVIGDGSQAPTTFTPLVPKDSSDVAGAKTSLEDAEGQGEVLSFPDTFLGKPVTVSQQKLPDNLKNEADPAGKLATQLGKTDKVSTAFGNAYFTTDESHRMQTIILVYKDSLVLITSNTHRDGESWKLYIESLRP